MRKAVLFLLIIAIQAMLLFGAGARAQSTQVLVAPASSLLAPGATVTVEVQVRDVLDLYAADLQLAFDPLTVEVVDADGDSTNGTQISAGTLLSSPYIFTAVNRVDNSTGQLRYMVSLLTPAAPVNGSGVLARITFRAREPGSSALRLQVLLADSLAAYIPAEVTDGLIVVSGNTATPTATVTRTATPAVTITPSRTQTRTGTPPVPDHFAWLPLLLRALSVPTLTPLPSATPMPTATALPVPTGSVTPTVQYTASPSPTASALPSATPTVGPTSSPSPTGSITPGATRSPTPTATAVATLSPTPQSRQLLLDPGFEVEDDAAWVREGGAPPVYTMARAHSGVRSIRLGIVLPQSEVYSSIWQEVNLPSQITQANLSLYYFPVGWPEDTDDIYLYVTRASDGATLFSDRWMRWEQVWDLYTVDLLSRLQSYAGQRIRLRIGVHNNGDGMTAVYLDDVELHVAGTY